MFGIIEFREDEHKRNISMLHQVKKDICQLLENLERTNVDERRDHTEYDIEERRGRRMGSRGGYGNHFPYPEHYPQYPMRDERYNY